ncbi:NAD(P)/FAD-dependent oxidoreductase [Persephonella sp.]
MKKIVVVGGGYGGVSFAKKFSKFNLDAEVYLVDKNPYHFLQPEVYNFIANKYLISDVIIDLSTLAQGLGKSVYFFKDKVVKIDFDKNTVIGEKFGLQYDYLILAVGSRTFFPPIEGLRKHSSGVKTLTRSLDFKQKFEQKILKKIQEEDKCYIEKEKQFNIVVGGAGLAGVEIAAEMAYYARVFFKKIGFLCEGLSITLIEAANTILPGQHPYVLEVAYNRLRSLGVDIITGKKITKVEPEKVFLEDGTEIKMDFLIWTGGIIGSTLIPRLGIKMNRKNQAYIDKYFRVEGFDNVFAIGDCAEIKDPDTGEIIPPTAQIAIQSGEIVADYIKSILKGEPLNYKKPEFKGMVSALGGKYGVGMVKNSFKVKGYPAYIFKELVFKHYKVPLKIISKKGYRELMKIYEGK